MFRLKSSAPQATVDLVIPAPTQRNQDPNGFVVMAHEDYGFSGVVRITNLDRGRYLASSHLSLNLFVGLGPLSDRSLMSSKFDPESPNAAGLIHRKPIFKKQLLLWSLGNPGEVPFGTHDYPFVMEADSSVPPTVTDPTIANSNRDITYVMYALLKRMGEETLVTRKEITVRRGLPWAEPQKVLLDGLMLENLVSYQLYVPELVYIGDPTASILVILNTNGHPLQLKSIQCTWVEVLTFDEQGRPPTVRENILAKVIRTSETMNITTAEISQKFEIPNIDTSPDCDHRAQNPNTHPLLKAYGGGPVVHHEVRVKVEFKRDRQVVLLVDGIMTKIPFACVVHPGSGGVRQRLDPSVIANAGVPLPTSTFAVTRGNTRVLSRTSSRNSTHSNSNSAPHASLSRLDNSRPGSANNMAFNPNVPMDLPYVDSPISAPPLPHGATGGLEEAMAHMNMQSPPHSSILQDQSRPSFDSYHSIGMGGVPNGQPQNVSDFGPDGYPAPAIPDEPPPPFETLSRIMGGTVMTAPPPIDEENYRLNPVDDIPPVPTLASNNVEPTVMPDPGVPQPPVAAVEAEEEEPATLDFLVGMQKMAIVAHEPENEDEITINVNDMLFIRQAWVDGYAYGMNLTTFEEGQFPQRCLFGDELPAGVEAPITPPATDSGPGVSPRTTLRANSIRSRNTLRAGGISTSPSIVTSQTTLENEIVVAPIPDLNGGRVALLLNQHRAMFSHYARTREELTVNVGDVISLDEVYENEWGFGVNDATKLNGWYPLVILGPDFGGPEPGGQIYLPESPAPPIPTGSLPPPTPTPIDSPTAVAPIPFGEDDEDDFIPIMVPPPAVKPVPPPRNAAAAAALAALRAQQGGEVATPESVSPSNFQSFAEQVPEEVVAPPPPVLEPALPLPAPKKLIVSCTPRELGDLFLIGAISLGEYIKMRELSEDLEALEMLLREGSIDGDTFVEWKNLAYERAVPSG
ncbi:hypothetical protein HDU97_000515 [Phlyctochytrium planicorne]|nr:hypothetical protein HDU97_000515 [Phlyctochytrium planicorne]